MSNRAKRDYTVLLNGDQGKGKLPKAGKLSEWGISLPGHMYATMEKLFIYFFFYRESFEQSL
jgi:hypothetical protein